MIRPDVPDSYREAHRYDGAAVEHGLRDAVEPCALQPRDIAIVRDVWRYKFLTAPQVRELWWSGSTAQAADRRLLKLFRAGHLERFRPYARRGAGSFPWTYHLGASGHRLLQGAGIVAPRHRYRCREVYDYGHVLHEIQLNAWVLAYRRSLGDAFRSWDGETVLGVDGRRNLAAVASDDSSVEGLKQGRVRPVYPDAVLEIDGDAETAAPRTLLVEYDRTGRPDKNFDKFVRYDAFLNVWWRATPFAGRRTPPFVVFVCQSATQREAFVAAADEEVVGYRWHPAATAEVYLGRDRMLFASEIDAHSGHLEAWRVPTYPPRHPDRHEAIRRVWVGPTSRLQRRSEADGESLADPLARQDRRPGSGIPCNCTETVAARRGGGASS